MAGSKSQETDPLQIDILLNEYQACHRNRNHYDSVRWTIGSIFIGASLTLFGLSLTKPLAFILPALIFSFGLMLVWYFYSQHVHPYIMRSMVRCHAIEKELRDLHYKIELHKSILDPKIKDFTIKGSHHSLWLVILVISMWFIGLTISLFKHFKSFSTEFYSWVGVIFVVYSVFLILFSYLHKKFNNINYQQEMKNAAGIS